MKASSASTAILNPNLGLYLGIDPLMVPATGLLAGENFRVKNGKLSNINLGWVAYSAIAFVDPITLIDTFFIRGVAEKNIVATTRNLYEWDAEADTALYLNARYATGTVQAGGGNDAFTKVLLTCDGSDLGTTFTDSNAGGSAHTWTAAGNAHTDTAEKKFGTASALLDGTGDYVSTPDHADFSLGSGAWTIDLWFNCTAPTGTNRALGGQGDVAVTAATTAWSLFRTTADKIRVNVYVGGVASQIDSTSTFTDAVNTGWHHVAVVRTGDILRMFIDGVQEGGDVAITGTVNNATDVLAIGALGAYVAEVWLGWIDEFRISVGIARWTAAFEPPGFAATTAALDIVLANSGTPAWQTNDIAAGDFINFTSATQRSLSATWYEIESVDSESQLTLTSAVPTPIAGTVYTIRRAFTGNLYDIWDSEVFVNPDDGTGDDLWFATNGVDYVVSWDGSATQVTIQSALDFTCKRLSVYKNMMIYANITQAGEVLPSSIINSDVGQPLDVSLGLASQFRIHDGVDHIHEIEDLGDNLIIYSERHVTVAQFVGDPLVFVFRDAASGIGTLATRVVADFGDYHEFLGWDSQYLFDGVSVTEVGKQVWREVLRTRDATRQQMCFNHFNEEQGELMWGVALSSDTGAGSDLESPVETAYVEHYLEEVGDRTPSPFSKRDFPFTCEGYSATTSLTTWDELLDAWEDTFLRWNDSFLSAAFPLSLMGTFGGTIMVINTVQTGAGAALPSYVRTARRALGDGRMRGLLARVYPFASQISPGTLDITVRLSDHASGPITDSETFEFDTALSEGAHFISPFRAARYFELQLGTDGSAWEITGYDIDTRPGGRR